MEYRSGLTDRSSLLYGPCSRPHRRRQMGVELGEALAPALLGASGYVRGQPLAHLEAGAPVGLVVELEPEPCLERLEAPGQVAKHARHAVEHPALGDVGEVDVHLRPDGRVVGEHLDEPLVAAGSDVELHLVEWPHAAGGPPPGRQVLRVGEGPVDEGPWRVEYARDGEVGWFGGH